MSALARVRVVLCRPRNPANLGSAARALKNAGLQRWTLVDAHALDAEAARPLAVHAADLLEQAELVDSLPEALAGCALSVATTVRPRAERPPLQPREAAQRLLSTPGEVALVFGDERNGLHAGEVELCDLVSAIPSAPAQPSWNLAQAIAVYAYELRMAALGGLPAGDLPRRDLAHPGQLAALDRALASALAVLGWGHVRRRLSRALLRGAPTSREAQLWTAALLALEQRLRGRGP